MVYGRGLCDIVVGSERPLYNRWFKMFERSYCEKYHKTRPSYEGCEVSEDWHKFSAFLDWAKGQPWQGRSLDKDIIKVGNKVYSEETCVFVPKFINSLLTNCTKKGETPLGVYYEPMNRKYRVQVHKGKGQIKAGDFDCPQEAHSVWLGHKIEAIYNAVDRWREEDFESFSPIAARSLIERAEILEEYKEKGKEVECLV